MYGIVGLLLAAAQEAGPAAPAAPGAAQEPLPSAPAAPAAPGATQEPIPTAPALPDATAAPVPAAEPAKPPFDPYLAIEEAEKPKLKKVLGRIIKNPRGPYSGLLWFCKDGTQLPPKLYACVPHGGGYMYAILGPDAEQLAEHGVHVGTILTALPDAKALWANDYYRARALSVEKYLERALDGWSLKGAKTYRGFRQPEDEKTSARRLLVELARRRDMLGSRRSLMMRLMRALPYGVVAAQADEIRALASVIGDKERSFAELRYKIHSMPEPADAAAVDGWAARKKGERAELARQLAEKIRGFYDPKTRLGRLEEVKQWVHDADTKEAIDAALAAFGAVDVSRPLEVLRAGHRLMESADSAIAYTTTYKAERNLLLLHAMGLVEELWIGVTAPLAQAQLTREEAIEAVRLLVRGAALVGLLSPREQEAVDAPLRTAFADAGRYEEAVGTSMRVLDWSRSRLLADVGIALARYEVLEPRARNVIDDALRSGLTLPLATVLDRLGRDVEAMRGGAHRLLGDGATSLAGLRGENPGIATGVLKVVEAGGELSQLGRADIALLHGLPPELPPVAGILTVGSGGGSLSHVALLARNLGIPHATVTGEQAAYLKGAGGKPIVLGVSVGRRVLVGPVEALAEVERAQVASGGPVADATFSIDETRLDLATARPLSLSELGAADSGVRVGPKAAEVARLKALFPDRVSDAVALPFGMFLKHVDRPGPRGVPSPWQRLRDAYAKARSLDAAKAEKLVLAEMAIFRDAIAKLPFYDGFEDEVLRALKKLGRKESFGVFVRSDTNVEDLKDFTGAGLNKTVPNRVRHASLFWAIREVWQSPYSERSYRWRQRLLTNPEHVYPSVLLHRTVPSEYSGVLVTTDIEGRWPDALTISTGEGVAAVVDGGAPETVVIELRDGEPGRQRLLHSSRPISRKVMPTPPNEGVATVAPENREPVLSDADIEDAVRLAAEVRAKMPATDVPWDIEFGFVGGHAHLLQIRPLRTARAPVANPLLASLDAGLEPIAGPIDPGAKLP